MRQRSLMALIATAIVVPMAAMVPLSPAATAAPQTDRYIVMMAGDPTAVASGLPKANGRVKFDSAKAKKYEASLVANHNKALSSAGIKSSAKKNDFTIAFNGFVAVLTDAEKARLAKTPGVQMIWEDEKRYQDTTNTPSFLGLDGTTGVWQSEFGGQANAGRGMIIGVIDSGIWPENPSFAPLSEPRPDQSIIDSKWNGVCDSGVEEPVACNNKLIGVRYYTEDATIIDEEFESPRDWGGHGSHTASTAAGNAGVTAEINGTDLGEASGMAPEARIAAYKVLWEEADHSTASGNTSALVHAIDDAVADGVDVINYSISGSRSFVVSPEEISFLFAADAGVFVATSAGNSGDTDGASSVAHNSPWTMTVAASTLDRPVSKSITLGNGASYDGVGVGGAFGPADLVNSTSAGLAGADSEDVRLCVPGSLDPAAVTGKIVVCDRGVIARVDKSLAVAEAGGVGMVLANVSDAQSLNGDFHSVPTIHVNATDGAAIKAYAGTAGASATINAVSDDAVRAPEMGGFSSFGPALAGGGDLLKPDITAPGVDVVAAVAPPGNQGNDFNAYSGTSMSSPHIAGIAALIMQDNPTWTPMMVKSAIMTTATTLDNTKKPIERLGELATPLDYGSGHVVPKKAFDPGLVYDSGFVDWLGYSCGVDQLELITGPGFCDGLTIDPSDLNYPSLAIGDLAGVQTVTRTVTNVTNKPSTYDVAVKAPAGIKVKATPSTFTIAPGASKTLTFTVTRMHAPLGEWAFGSYTLRDARKHVVTSPIAIRSVAIAAPAEITGELAAGSTEVALKTGFAGTLDTTVSGLVPATVDTLTVPLNDPDDESVVELTVPAGTTALRVATYDADYAPGTDVDLFVFDAAFEFVGQSAGGSSEEVVTLEGADLGGTYYVLVDFFAGSGSSLDVELNSFALDGSDAGNLTVAPSSQPVTTGGGAAVTLDWSSVAPGVRYFGAVNYSTGGTKVGQTWITVVP